MRWNLNQKMVADLCSTRGKSLKFISIVIKRPYDLWEYQLEQILSYMEESIMVFFPLSTWTIDLKHVYISSLINKFIKLFI